MFGSRSKENKYQFITSGFWLSLHETCLFLPLSHLARAWDILTTVQNRQLISYRSMAYLRNCHRCVTCHPCSLLSVSAGACPWQVHHRIHLWPGVWFTGLAFVSKFWDTPADVESEWMDVLLDSWWMRHVVYPGALRCVRAEQEKCLQRNFLFFLIIWYIKS